MLVIQTWPFKVTDGSTTTAYHGGNVMPAEVTSSGQSLTLLFKTDNSNIFAGFTIQVTNVWSDFKRLTLVQLIVVTVQLETSKQKLSANCLVCVHVSICLHWMVSLFWDPFKPFYFLFYPPLYIFAKEIFFRVTIWYCSSCLPKRKQVVECCQILWGDPAYTPYQLFRKSNFRLTVSDSNDIGY